MAAEREATGGARNKGADGGLSLLEADRGLADGLSKEEAAAAGRALRASTAELEPGEWRPPPRPSGSGHLGYLIVAGLLVRRVEVAGGRSVELLGRGDLLRPWQEDASSFCRAGWEVLEPTTLAVLGPALARRLGRWPAIVSNLLARGVGRSRSLAADAAVANIVGIEQRLLILLWQLAESWGEMGPDGVRVEVRLPHRLLAELLGARRPSVTSALADLRRAGRLDETPDGRWLLLGDPPLSEPGR